MAQSRLSSEVAAHTVHSPARRRGRRAEIDSPRWCRIRYEADCGACEELPEVLDSAIDVTPNVIGIVSLKFYRGGDVTRQDAFAKARCEAFNLGLNTLCHIER